MITVSLRWRNKSEPITGQRSVITWEDGLPTATENTLCLMESLTHIEHVAGNQKELYNNTERRVCGKQITGLSEPGPRLMDKKQQAKRRRRDPFQTHVTRWPLRSHIGCRGCIIQCVKAEDYLWITHIALTAPRQWVRKTKPPSRSLYKHPHAWIHHCIVFGRNDKKKNVNTFHSADQGQKACYMNLLRQKIGQTNISNTPTYVVRAYWNAHFNLCRTAFFATMGGLWQAPYT